MSRKFLSNYFGFNRQQRNGFWVLLLICFLLLIIRLVYPYFMSPAKIVVQDLPLVERRLDSAYRAGETPAAAKRPETISSRKLFDFDPNLVSAQDLARLGFSESTASTLIKFRSKGFVFKYKSDLKKVYGISGRFYTLLEPYISLPAYKDRSAADAVQQASDKPARTGLVDLNQADSLSLCSLEGLTPAMAGRILKYRSLLGGYVSVQQLKEVYGLKDKVYEKLQLQLSVDPASVRKLDLNRDAFRTLLRHPYLNYGLVKTIMDWRDKTTLNATNLKPLLNDSVRYRKLLPYLTYD